MERQLTDGWPMGDLTVGAVIQVNLSCFILLYSNTATQKTFIYQTKNVQIRWLKCNGSNTEYNHRNHATITTLNSVKSENDLPSMEPVLTNVTLNHEACHIIW